jgi:hypothetical protein
VSTTIGSGGVFTCANDAIIRGVRVGTGGMPVSCTVVGNNAGNNGIASGVNNTLIGSNCAASLTTAANNTLIGNNCGLALTGGNTNTAIGSNCFSSAIGAAGNTLVGYNAGNAAVSTASCCFIGHSAGIVTTANNNTFLGANSGVTNTTGNNNTCLGFNATCSSIASVHGTTIGANSVCPADNTIQLGTTSTNVNCPNTLSVVGALSVTGDISLLNTTTGTIKNTTIATNTGSGSIQFSPKGVVAMSIDQNGVVATVYGVGVSIGPIISSDVVLATPPKSLYFLDNTVAGQYVYLPAVGLSAGRFISLRKKRTILVNFALQSSALVMVPFNSFTAVAVATMTAAQYSSSFVCDGTFWYQMNTQ